DRRRWNALAIDVSADPIVVGDRHKLRIGLQHSSGAGGGAMPIEVVDAVVETVWDFARADDMAPHVDPGCHADVLTVEADRVRRVGEYAERTGGIPERAVRRHDRLGRSDRGTRDHSTIADRR